MIPAPSKTGSPLVPESSRQPGRGRFPASGRNTHGPAQPGPSGESGQHSPIIVLHGGYTSQLPEQPELSQAAQDMLALIAAQADDYLQGRGRRRPKARCRRHCAVCRRTAGGQPDLQRRHRRPLSARRRYSPHGGDHGAIDRWHAGFRIDRSGAGQSSIPSASPMRDCYEARSQPRLRKTGHGNVHLSGETSLEYLLENQIPSPA